MGKIRVGNKINSWLNGQWASHAKKDGKDLAHSRRRQIDKVVVNEEIEYVDNMIHGENDDIVDDWSDYSDSCPCELCLEYRRKKKIYSCARCYGTGKMIVNNGSTINIADCNECDRTGDEWSDD